MQLPDHLQTIAPRMWPGFRSPWQRRFNARSMEKAIRAAIGHDGHAASQPITAITTLPIVADLVGRLPVQRWVYYCVDDFSVWPGVDGTVMDLMERSLVGKVHQVIAVSETLQSRLQGIGRTAKLLTHGIDLDHWAAAPSQSSQSEPSDFPVHKKCPKTLPSWCSGLARPILLFWGLIDARLDVNWCQALTTQSGGTLVLAGPMQSPPGSLMQMAHPNHRPKTDMLGHGRLVMPGPVAYDDLPTLAAWADVLVMPYADMPVTRAMQPLKFKEYLAAGYPQAGKPVIARNLPALAPWLMPPIWWIAPKKPWPGCKSACCKACQHRSKSRGCDCSMKHGRPKR